MGYLAVTNEEFREKISTYYKYKTGLGTNILLMTVISFVVGLSISGQTFYTFILENLDKFGALKAIGAKSHELIVMIVFQAGFTALTGYGLGVGLCTLMISFGETEAPQLCEHGYLHQSGHRLCHGTDHRHLFQLYRHTESA